MRTRSPAEREGEGSKTSQRLSRVNRSSMMETGSGRTTRSQLEAGDGTEPAAYLMMLFDDRNQVLVEDAPSFQETRGGQYGSGFILI